MSEDTRAVLEGIAFGSDPKVTPNDRLRALEMLEKLALPEDAEALFLARQVAGMTDEQLDEALIEYAPGKAAVMVGEVFDVARLIEERAKELAQVADDRAISEGVRRLERVANRQPADAAPTAADVDDRKPERGPDRPTEKGRDPKPDETGYSQHIPPGMSARAWEAAWPTGRYRW